MKNTNPRISVIIITKNSSDVLQRALESVRNLADELIVVDAYSNDGTRDIAQKYSARVYLREDKDLGEQKAYALEKAQGTWILSLDSDEIVTPELREEIRTIVSRQETDKYGYLIPYKNFVFGRGVQHGGESYKMLRLFKKTHGNITPSLIHERFELVSGTPGVLKNPIIHNSYRSLPQIFAKFTNYGRREAQRKYRENEDISIKKIILYPVHMFWARFIKDKGYRDGFFRIPVDLGYAYMEWLTYVLLFKKKVKKGTFLFNFFSLNISSFGIRILTFILFIYLVKFLSPKDYGIYNLVWAQITILSPLMDFGTTSYSVVHVTHKEKGILQSIFSLRLYLYLIGYLLTFIMGVVLFFNQTQTFIYLILTSVVIASNMSSGSYFIWTAVKQKAYVSSYISLIMNGILTGALVVSLIIHPSLNTVFSIIFFVYLSYFILMILILNKESGFLSIKLRIKEWIAIMKKSYVFVLISFFAALYFKIDVFLLRFLKGNTEVGIYSAGYKFFEALLFIILSYNISATPILAQLKKTDYHRFLKRVKRDVGFLAILGLGVAGATWAFSPLLLKYVLTNGYVPSIDIVRIVIFALPFLLINAVFSNVIYIYDKAFYIIVLYISQTFITIGLNLLFIPRYSYFASSYITVFSEILNMCVLYAIVTKLMKRKIA